MATRTSDVNLIIRARTEGEKAVEALGNLINGLGGNAATANVGVAELGSGLATLDKLFATVSGKADTAAQAFGRQTGALANAKAELRDLTRQASEYERNMDSVRQGIVSGVLSGKDVSPLRSTLVELNGEMGKLDTRSVQLRRTIDGLESGVNASRSSLQQLGSTVNAVEETQVAVRQRIDATTEALGRQERAAKSNGAAMEAIRRSQYQDSGKSAELTAGVFGRTGLTETERKILSDEQKAQQLAAGPPANQQIGLFGLKPYELQNLSYQINDVVTQLASGTSLTQTMAQQGGQILQLFPKVSGAIIGGIKGFGLWGVAAAATITTVVAAVYEAVKAGERLREFSADLTLRTDSSGFSAQGLSDQTRALENMGIKAKDAEAAVKELLNDGINPDRLSQFAQAALATSRVLGEDLPTAAQQVAEAFTNGYEAVARLDDKLNFLTASERAHIQQLFMEGNANAARTEALNAYTRQMDAAAQKQRGPWSDALRDLSRLWHEFINSLAQTPIIQGVISYLNLLAEALHAVAGAMPDDVKAGATNSASAKIASTQAQVKQLEKDIADYNAQIAKGSPIAGTLRALVTQSQRQLEQAKAQLAALETKSPDTANDDPNGKKAKDRAERLADIDLEQQLQTLRRNGQDDGLSKSDSKRRETLAGELAFRQEMKSTGDAIVAGRLRERAVAEETLKVDKENEDARKKAQAEREREIGNFERRVIGAEGGAGKNPNSSAKGYGQFTEGTWLGLVKKVAPQYGDQSRDQLLALRQNEAVARGVIDEYARENAKFLESFGAKVTAGNLYLAHFLGAAGAKAVLTADGATPVDQIIRRLPNSDQVLSGNQGYLRTEGGKGRYRTAGELQTFIGARVGDTGTAQTEAQAAINKLLEDAARRQNDFNLAVAHGNEERERGARAATAEYGLADVALIAEQRRQAVAQAVLELQQKAEDANKTLKPGEAPVVVSPEQIADVQRLTGALFDAQHAADLLKAKLDNKERPLNDLQQQQQILQQQADFLRSIGENEGADKLDKQVSAISAKIQAATEQLVEFYKSLTPEQLVTLGIKSQDELDGLIDKLKIGGEQTQQWGKIAGVSSQQIAQSFASGAAQSFTNFINKIASGKNVFKSLGESVREFAANFLQSVAQMIIQLLAFAAVVSILKVLGVPVPANLFPAATKHTGGVAGRADGNGTRMLPPGIFGMALRYHNGGIAGLKPNEVPTVLEEGEEVLTTSNPRHINNAGKGGGATAPAGNVTVIQVPDHAAALEQGLRSPQGSRVFFDFVGDNRGAFKAAMGG